MLLGLPQQGFVLSAACGAGLRTRNLDVKVLQAIFELLQAHYPERLAALWFLNAPFIFWGVWRLVQRTRPLCTRSRCGSPVLAAHARLAAMRLYNRCLICYHALAGWMRS